MVNKELKKVKMWPDVNKLSLNDDKTKFIIVKSPQHSSPESVLSNFLVFSYMKICHGSIT